MKLEAGAEDAGRSGCYWFPSQLLFMRDWCRSFPDRWSRRRRGSCPRQRANSVTPHPSVNLVYPLSIKLFPLSDGNSKSASRTVEEAKLVRQSSRVWLVAPWQSARGQTDLVLLCCRLYAPSSVLTLPSCGVFCFVWEGNFVVDCTPPVLYWPGLPVEFSVLCERGTRD